MLDMLPTIKQASIYFAFCISIPSTLLYVYLCLTIVARPQFHTTFYALFLVRFVTDVLYLLDSVFSYRVSALGLWMPMFQALPRWALALTYFLSIYTQHADNLATVLMLLNRWTAIGFPLRQRKIWRIFLPIAVLLVFLLPLPFSLFIMGINLQIVPEPNSTAFAILEQPDPETGKTLVEAISAQSAVSAMLFLLISALLNVAILVSYKRFCRTTTAAAAGHGHLNANENERRIEKKLLLYAVITFLGHLLAAMLTLLIYAFSSLPAEQKWLLLLAYTQYPWVFDLGCIALPSWLLLWASTPIREQLVADFRAICPPSPRRLVKYWGRSRIKTTATAVQPFPTAVVVAATGSKNSVGGGGRGATTTMANG